MADVAEKLVMDSAELAACVEHLAALRRFGLDTEFVGEETYHPHLCLVQIATEDTLYLVDPLSVGPLDAFWKVVVDPASLVVVHAGREEVRLCQLWSGHGPGQLFDLQIAAGLVGMPYPLGHGALVNQVLGVRLSKGETLTEWRHRPLTKSQIRYALDDVRYLLPMWQQLSDRLERLNRSAWAKEEFERMVSQVTADIPGLAVESERWRKLRGLGPLDRRRLAMARELYLWREQVAAKANRPARSVVRDDLIIEIVRRNPTKPVDLQMIRGLAKRYLDDIVRTIDRAREVPIDECPAVSDREQDPPQVTHVGNLLNAVLADFAARNHLAANLVASTSDVKMLARARYQRQPPPADCLLTQGWRAAHVLPELQAVAEGRRWLRVADIKADSPFAFQDA
jgi:ribonuclease D